MSDGNGRLIACGYIGATEGKAGRVEMVEALINAFPRTDRQGKCTQQKITAIRIDLIECTAQFKAVEHLGLDTVMQQQVEGFIGKKLRRQGQGPMGKPQAIENHPSHGFAWRNGLLLIGYEPGVDHVNEAQGFDDTSNESEMIQALDAQRSPQCTSPEWH